jgi:tetratricopeptide (TPR) repeat protein
MGGVFLDTNLQTSATYAGKAIQLYQRYPPSLELVATLNLLGQRQVMQEQFPEGVATLSRAASVANSLQGEARRPLPAIYAVLAEGQRHLLDISGAEKSGRLAIQVARTLKGEDSVDVLQTQWRLGNFLVQTSRVQEGLDLLKKSVDLAVRTRGPDEVFHTPMVRRAYGVNLLRYGSVEEGLLPLTQAMEVHRKAKRSGNQDFAITLEAIAPGEIDLGHYRQAQALLDEAFTIRAVSGQGYSRQLDDALMAKAKLLLATGNAEEAMSALQQIPEKADFSGKITYSWLNVSLARAEVNVVRERPEAAIDQAALVQKRIIESGLASYFKRWEAHAALLQGQGLLLNRQATDALPLLERAVQLGAEVLDPKHSLQLADSEIALASCLLDLSHRDEARPLLAQAKAIHSSYRDLGEQFKTPLRQLEARMSGSTH